ncbi:hypothetical protein AAFF_G00055700 [Aldrovandia affinis]|uniref:Uncharacterized protein n=1 Tax=Aldrovandia affinis TaxID=143900 RepID=A0AAD7S0N0_9TELE|nr:hypothetical protein AAFF_G00055700 [Aldrovandia affinis]
MGFFVKESQFSLEASHIPGARQPGRPRCVASQSRQAGREAERPALDPPHLIFGLLEPAPVEGVPTTGSGSGEARRVFCAVTHVKWMVRAAHSSEDAHPDAHRADGRKVPVLRMKVQSRAHCSALLLFIPLGSDCRFADGRGAGRVRTPTRALEHEQESVSFGATAQVIRPRGSLC